MSAFLSLALESDGLGPIEKGANDGQEKYANDIVAALKSNVSSKARPSTATGKGGKGRRRKKSSSEAVAETTGGKKSAVTTQAKNVSWGVFEPLRGPVLEPMAELLRPAMTSNAIIGLLVLLLALTWLRSSARPTAAAKEDLYLSRPRPERIAAYEEIWRREESDLWDWLDERISLSTLVASKGEQPRAGVEDEKHLRLARKAFATKVKADRMGRRQVDDAIRVTQQRLDALKAAVDRKEEKAKNKDKDRAKGKGNKPEVDQGGLESDTTLNTPD